MYVPQALVPWLRRGLENGRQLEKLLSAQGPLILKITVRKETATPGRQQQPSAAIYIIHR